jgi:hypothetical protein
MCTFSPAVAAASLLLLLPVPLVVLAAAMRLALRAPSVLSKDDRLR